MNILKANYFDAYRSLKLTRDAKGVLVVEFHSNGGPCTFSALHHTEVVDAFHRIAQDRANKIVILTGAGGDFIIGVDWSSFGDVSDPGVWSQIHDEGSSGFGKHRKHSRAGHRGDRGTRAYSLRLCAARQCDRGGRGSDLPGRGALRGGRHAGRRNLYHVELSRWSRTSGGVPSLPKAAAGAHGA